MTSTCSASRTTRGVWRRGDPLPAGAQRIFESNEKRGEDERRCCRGRLIDGPRCSCRTRGGSRLGRAEPAAHVLPASHSDPRPGLRDPPANEPRRDVECVHAVLKHPDPYGGPRCRPPAGRPVRGCPGGSHGRAAPPPAGAPQRGLRGPRVNGHYACRVPQVLLPILVRHVTPASLLPPRLRFPASSRDPSRNRPARHLVGPARVCDQNCLQW